MKAVALVAALALAQTAAAQPLTHVRVYADHAASVAALFEHEGHDVVEGGVRDGSFELVVTDDELARLGRDGLTVEVISRGRPFADIQAPPGQLDIPAGYPTLDEIYQEMNDIAAAFPAICRVVDLTAAYGTPDTANGRHMYAMKISDNVNSDEDEPSMLVICNHHAREIGTAVVGLDTIQRLTSGYGSNQALTDFINGNEVWVMPMANPDGYFYMFNTNNLWRKNRRPNGNNRFGVDQNRNYPLGWSAPCAGSTSTSSDTYKGPSAGSEPETKAIMALSDDRHFTKVIDYHSYGRETLYGYNCLSHPFTSYMQSEATLMSQASGYGDTREPSAEGEEEEWQLARRGSHAFLTEIGVEFQPEYAAAQSEAAMVWGGTQWLMNRAIPVSGHVKDAVTGQPVAADITYLGVVFSNGEANRSEPRFGRYHAFLPAGGYTVHFAATGYVAQDKVVTVTQNTGQVIDVLLQPIAPPCYPDCNGDGVLNLSDFGCFTTKFALGDPYADCNGDGVRNLADFGCFTTKFALGCP
ncbi:MAG: hypothetical protein IT437_07710 [Phycisphaerales bacterium]|nr:hypothetical protein [Phycisphaerales bacterium]